MYHICAYEQTLATVTQTDIAAISDQVMSIRNSHFVPAVDMQLIGCYVTGAQVSNVQMVTPRIRSIVPQYIVPVNVAALPVKFDRIMDWRRNPFLLKQSEELQFLVTDGASTSSTPTIIPFLGVTPPNPVHGEIYKFRFTSTTAAVAFTWTDLTVTFQQTLPAGLYSVVGGSYYAANAIAMRVIFPGQVWRPGCIGYATEPGASVEVLQNGQFDTWGTFSTIALPIIEIFNASTDNSHTGYLDIIKVG